MITPFIRISLGLMACLAIAACSTIPTSAPVAPTVKLLSVTPVKLGLRKQELAFQLEVSNPNAYDLPLQSLSFIAELEGSEVAQGISNDAVTLPANAKATVEVIVSTRLNRILGQILQLAGSNSSSVNYDVNGFVKLSNWPLNIPFSVDGELIQ